MIFVVGTGGKPVSISSGGNYPVVFFFKNNLKFALFIGCAGSSSLLWLSLVAVSGGYSRGVACRLLFALAALIEEHRL